MTACFSVWPPPFHHAGSGREVFATEDDDREVDEDTIAELVKLMTKLRHM